MLKHFGPGNPDAESFRKADNAHVQKSRAS
jgi:hypothetical protein